MTNMYFSICALLCIILLLAIYFSKSRVNSIETKVYGYMLISSCIDVILVLIAVFLGYMHVFEGFIKFLNKVDFIHYIVWPTLMFLYIFYITYKDEKKYNKLKKILIILDTLFIIVEFCLPIDIINEQSGAMGVAGIGTNVVYGFATFYFMMILFVSIVNFKKIFSKKYIPFLALFLLMILAMYVRTVSPTLIVLPAIIVYINLIMFFTIENPDVKMIEQLNIAKMDAEKANRAKSDFLSSMSHEIRTPLNAIVGFSEMIENENTIEGCKENAKDIVLASHTLLEIVNGILDISKIEANKMEIVNKEYSLLPELENLAKLMVPRLEDKPIELKTQFAPDIPAIMYGDIGKIKQVITNILTNACKYTEKGEINFNVNCINEDDVCSLVISVEDTGRGIKPDKIDSLFTKFERLEEDRNTTIEGTGLGLAITKSLTEMMGGKIIVQSAYGEGSKFIVYLRQKIVSEKTNVEDEIKQEENITFNGSKVLVVDDNKLNLKVADKLLKTYGLSTTLVETGMECIDLIKQGNKYDLILMDDMMPRLRGPEVLLRLKQLPDFIIPTIALTANATEGVKEGYINEGFNDYLAKPIEKQELIRVLKTYLNSSNAKIVEETKETPVVIESGKKQVLIVDDNKINIKIAVTMMKPYDFEIDEALSGAECIEMVKNKKYDLIFMDYMMPNMDGIETLNNLKALPNFETCSIALTADATSGSREKFLNAGFDEYVAKPIDRKVLDDVINKMLDMKSVDETKEVKEDFNKVEYLKSNQIDVDHGIELLGDMEMYEETLRLFMENLCTRFNKINTFKINNDMPSYAVEVHSLKSDSKYLGFTKLAEISYEHELKSKANDVDYVNKNYNELVIETKRVFEIAKKYFNI